MNTNVERRAYATCAQCGGQLERVVTFTRKDDAKVSVVVDLCLLPACLDAQTAAHADYILTDDGLPRTITPPPPSNETATQP